MVQQIRNYLNAVPFQPFEIHTSSGEIFRVEHPENAAVVKNWVMVATEGDNALMLSPLHIVAVEGLNATLS